jgi:hypothetical protein
LPADEVYDLLGNGDLLDNPQSTALGTDWARADVNSFAPQD